MGRARCSGKGSLQLEGLVAVGRARCSWKGSLQYLQQEQPVALPLLQTLHCQQLDFEEVHPGLPLLLIITQAYISVHKTYNFSL